MWYRRIGSGWEKEGGSKAANKFKSAPYASSTSPYRDVPQVNGRSSVDVNALALLHSLFLASASAVDNPCRYAYGGGA
jgi:hypothetical protein